MRLLLKVPLCVWCDGVRPLRAHTAVVNDHGALILAPCALRSDERIRILNQDNGRTALCRVVWCGGEDLPGLYKVGIEILDEGSDLWGDDYRRALAQPGADPSRA